MVKKLIILYICLIFGGVQIYSQTYYDFSQENLFKSILIYDITQNTIWSSLDTSNFIYIGVLSKNKIIYSLLEDKFSKKRIKNKQVKVLYFSTISGINKYVHVLYVDNTRNNDVIKIYTDVINGKPTMLITDNYLLDKYIMINILPLQSSGKKININNKNILSHNLSITELLMMNGGSEEELKHMYSGKKKEFDSISVAMQKEKEKFEKLKNEYTTELEAQKQEISKQKQEIEEQLLKYQDMLTKNERQQNALKDNNKRLSYQYKLLSRKESEISEKNKELRTKENILQSKINSIEAKQQKLDSLEVQIEETSSNLTNANKKIETQKSTIKVTLIFIAIIFLFVIFLVYFLRKNSKMNKELKHKNIEINSQKDRIETQANELETTNKELEQLSIVAENAQNGVVIMDKNGDILWLNAGFTRMYGYTLQLLISELDKNIRRVSSSTEIEKFINRCVEQKIDVTYKKLTKKRNGDKIWVKTTLTPILGADNEVEKLVAIDTDISEIKEAEEEIINKNTELTEQNAKIEHQNSKINSSIEYALTIQQSILPLQSETSKYFQSEVLFYPKDVVSGDFYWFCPSLQKDIFFVASVDCTGHGVPGAFMSLITNRILNNIVNNNQNIDAHDILEKTNKQIIKTLNQRTTNNKDGLDIALCRIEKKKSDYEVSYAGAKNNLFIYDKTQQEISIIKADRKSIGGNIYSRNNIEFTTKKVSLQSGDIIYLSTDGYIDQNNEQRKRFGTTKYLKLLNEIKDKELNEQKQILQTHLTDFMINTEQRDDITVWLLKLI